MYKLISRIFGRNSAYKLLVAMAAMLDKLPFLRSLVRLGHHYDRSKLQAEVFGLDFRNQVGLGPGIDKDARMLSAMRAYGFGFVCIGPVDSDNVRHIIHRLQENYYKELKAACIVGDHVHSFSLSYDFLDLFIIDSPMSEMYGIMDQVLDTRLTYDRYKPVLLKISHDLSEEQLQELVNYCLMNGVDGLMVAKAENVRLISRLAGGFLPIIGYGGIRCPADADAMLDAGASLVAITTGIILDGPSLARKILKHFESNR